MWKIEFKLFAPTAITFNLLRRQLKKTVKYVHGDLLDVGCGQRPYADIFAPRAGRYVGVDVAAGPNVDIVADAAKGLPINDQAYDTIVCTEMLEHTPYPRESIAEIARVLKKGGYLIVSAPFVHKLHGEPFDYFRFSPHILRLLLEESGLKVVDLHYVGTSISVLGRSIGDIVYSFADFFGTSLLHRPARVICMLITGPIVWISYFVDCVASRVSFLKHSSLGFVFVATREP